MINVAMDVHVRNSVVLATAPDGRILRKGRVGNGLLEFGTFLAPVERAARESGERVLVTLENTTNARGLARLLERYGREAHLDLSVQAVNPRKMRVIAESVCKCDKIDVAMLNELAASNLRLPLVWLPDDEVFSLREHLRARSDLVRLRTMVKNRIHSIFHRRCILTPTGELFGARGRRFLEEMKKQLDEPGQMILDRWTQLLGDLNQQLMQSEKELATVAEHPRWQPQVRLLRSQPGVGLITALTTLAELGDINRFRSRSAVSNFAGMVPVLRSSNEKHFSGHITRRGPAHLRAMLVQAAWTAIRFVPAYASIYQRVQARHNSQVAIVAVARRMLEDAWTMLKRNEPFRYSRTTPQGACGDAVDAITASPSLAG
jgi:transposase